jgi:hypothetical protein
MAQRLLVGFWLLFLVGAAAGQDTPLLKEIEEEGFFARLQR